MWRGKNAGPAIAAGISLMGQPTELEGKRAVTLPLRFDDGMVSLGPLKLGVMPPLFLFVWPLRHDAGRRLLMEIVRGVRCS